MLTLAVSVVSLDIATATGTAYFWLSTSSVTPPGPEVASVTLAPGASDTLYLWARPAAGKKLRNVSLNLVADASGVDFDDTGTSIYNTLAGPVTRFQFVHDASSTPPLTSSMSLAEVASGGVDSLIGIQGFTVIGASDIRGVGAECVAGETNCFAATDGSPAWLLGEIAINAISVGTVNLNLQVGDVGILHETVPPGDYNYDAEVDTDDFDFWLASYGSMGATFAASADSNEDGVIDAVDYAAWREGLGSVGAVETAAMTYAVFGADISADTEPPHNALTDRSINLMFDDRDAVITIAAPIVDGAVTIPEPTAAVPLATSLVAFGLRRRRQ